MTGFNYTTEDMHLNIQIIVILVILFGVGEATLKL